MSNTVIRVENLGKRYTLTHNRQSEYKTLRDTIAVGMNSLATKLVKPNGKKTRSSNHEEFWALRDISFEVKQGDRIGIIGRNGAGKSTLLKILSRIVEPTTGHVAIKGRVASLLEVGTGFHPELTGRENIFLNGAILGMSKVEIKQKFDEIVDFAEVEKFLDTPVKRYSSGMYVRLAFAVAAHLEPEILILDEVLAVGDINFQKKCFSKMQHISKEQGRTILFVSHSMESIQRLCSSCLLLKNGRLIDYGKIDSIVSLYLSSNSYRASADEWINLSNAVRTGTGKARFSSIRYSSLNQSVNFQPYPSGPLNFLLDIESALSQSVASLAVTIANQTGIPLVNVDTLSLGQEIFLKKGRNKLQLEIDALHLTPGLYTVGLWLHKTGVIGEPLDYLESAFEIEVVSLTSNTFGITTVGFVQCQFSLLEMS